MTIRSKLWIGGVLGLLIVAAIAVMAVFETGLAEQWMRNALVSQIQERTGTRIEMGGFHVDIWRLRAEISGLTVHGLETSGEPPLFHADHVDVAIRILSLFGRKISLDELIVDRPQAVVRIEKDGRSNIPRPRVAASNRPWRDTLFSLRIARLELRNGSAIFNDRRIPLAMQGRNLEFDLHYNAAAPGADAYIGDLRWQQVELAERRWMPFRFDVSAKFSLHRDSFELDELVCKLAHSQISLRAEMASFSRPDWALHYRGRLSLADVRTIFRSPTTPDGIADFSGQARYASALAGAGKWTASGYYKAHDIRMPYRWFHASGFETWGDYQVAGKRLVVPNFRVQALSGSLDGRLELNFHDLAFRVETHMHHASLAAALAAVDNSDFPVDPLHWDGAVDVDSVNTWDRNFKHFRSTGETRWSPPQNLAPGMIPATAQIHYDYSTDQNAVAISQGEITLPKTQLRMNGFLGAADSALDVAFRTGDLGDWDDFINAIRGHTAAPRRITGTAAWDGRILGPIVGPTFIGHVHATKARYDKLAWDDVEGELEYSPDDFRLTKTIVRHGGTSANLDLSLVFDGDWSFLPSSPWTLSARVERAPSEDLLSMFDMSYPISGFLSGTVRGSGTRAAPVLDSDFVFEDIKAGRFQFDRLSGRLHAQHDELSLSAAELRVASESVAGSVLYRPEEKEAEFDVSGTGILLEKIDQIQSPSLPMAGKLEFHLKGSGPLRAPIAAGTMRLVNLKLGNEAEGNFNGQLSSDGRSASISLSSDPGPRKLQGHVTVGLMGDAPLSGQLSVERFDLDPFLVAGLHLQQPTAHSSADGVFTISGALRQPDSIKIEADITRISFDYELVQLTNDQDIQLTYQRNVVSVSQARLHGTDTDLQLTGSARFDGDQPLHVTLSGGVNLRLLTSLLPDLQARGRANANISIEGTISQPQVTGRASVREASANYADFPVGLNNVNGDLLFDKRRLVFDRITAESGGGQLALSGSVTYGEGPMRYEVNATTSLVRIRYPAGMSWLVGGTLQLSGTRTAAIMTGRVQVQRLLFAQGVDVASFFASASDVTLASASISPFLQNLTFDVAAQTNAGALIEWSGAQIQVDGNVRLRGTWDRPVLLGNVHLLGGQMPFRGNTFQLTRGDISFANPFRLDPVLNVEATTTISQYQVTIDFSGPASRLTMNYRSDPPLPDTDVIGLLALGRTGEETSPISSTSSQNYGATALLSEAISSGLGGRIERLFGISQFRVDPFVAGTATESNAAARITIQQQVQSNLTITYSTNAATSNQYQMIQVEYSVKRNLSVVFLRDINGTNGLDIKWVKHFK
ncbi:MAG: translocation/assembly module TamB domain-containing protein [Candidatus Acidiferrales bacterium]